MGVSPLLPSSFTIVQRAIIVVSCVVVAYLYAWWLDFVVIADSQNVFLNRVVTYDAAALADIQRPWPTFQPHARVAMFALRVPLARLSPDSMWVASHAAVGLVDVTTTPEDEAAMTEAIKAGETITTTKSMVLEFGPLRKDRGLGWVMDPNATAGRVFVGRPSKRWVTSDYVQTISGRSANEYLQWARRFSASHTHFSVAQLRDVVSRPDGASSCHDFLVSSLKYFGMDREFMHRETVVFYGSAMTPNTLFPDVDKFRIFAGELILRAFLPWIEFDFTLARTPLRIAGALGLALQVPGLPVFVPHAPYIDYCITTRHNETCAMGAVVA